MTRARQLALLVAPALVGCAVDGRVISAVPDPIVIDTFESLTTTHPLDHRFRRWERTIFGTDQGMIALRIAQPGYDSAASLELEWQLTEPQDGVQSFPGALIRIQALGSIDLTGLSALSFEFMLRAEGLCKPSQSLAVNLGCAELNTGVTVPLLAPLGTWTVADLALSQFAEPSYARKGVAPADCLTVVDEVQLVASATLADGECASGDLFIDDVRFR